MLKISYQKILLKSATVFLAINGLSPFSYDSNKSVIRSTKRQYLYSSIVAVALSVFLIVGSIHIDYSYYNKTSDVIVFLVIIFELIFGTMKTLAFFVLHIFYPFRIINLVNDALKMNKIVTRFSKSTTVSENEIEKILKMKIISTLLQIFCLLLMISDLDFCRWFILSYPLVVSMMATVIYIFGGFLITLKSVYIVNENLYQLSESFGSEGCTDIDEVSVILNVIQQFTTNLNAFYGKLITLTFIGSMFLILSSVQFFLEIFEGL